MSFPNTVIAYQTRYRWNGTLWAATGGRVEFLSDLARVTDSESAGGRRRKSGPFEVKVTIRGKLATDISPFSVPFSLGFTAPGMAVNGAMLIALLEIFTYGFANPADTFTNLVVESYTKDLPDPDTGEANNHEIVGYTSSFVIY